MTAPGDLRRLSAMEELEARRRYPRLLPLLLRMELEPADALALAFNATLLHFALPRSRSPREVLSRYGLGEIAALCEAYRGLGEGDGLRPGDGEWEEWAVNESY